MKPPALCILDNRSCAPPSSFFVEKGRNRNMKPTALCSFVRALCVGSQETSSFIDLNPIENKATRAPVAPFEAVSRGDLDAHCLFPNRVSRFSRPAFRTPYWFVDLRCSGSGMVA